MKYRTEPIKDDRFLVVNLLPKKTVDRLNFLLQAVGEYPVFREVKSKRVILPEDVEDKFYKRLMEEIPGFSKRENV